MKNVNTDAPPVAEDTGHLTAVWNAFLNISLTADPPDASQNMAMNVSVVAGWNGSADDLLFNDYLLGGVEEVRGNSSGGRGNESEYEYDYEVALETFYWSQLAPPLAVYAVTYLVGVAGNGLIIFTICRFRRLKTTTNVFLASLASADLLLVLLCIPVKIARLFSYSWTMGYALCKLIYYMQAVSALCSVLTLTVLSMERCYAIVYPMRAMYVCSISKARRAALVIWVAAFFLAAPTLRVQVHMEVGARVRAFWCVRDWDSPRLWRGYETYMMVVVLLLPASVMAAAYTAIGGAIVTMVARRRAITGKGQIADGGSLLNDSSRRRRRDAQDSEVLQVVSMLVVVVLLFVLCWSPVLVVNMLKAYAVVPVYSATLKHVSTVADLLSYCNSCVNPFVYGFMSKNFRKSFKQVLCCRRGPPLTRTHTHMSLTRTSIMRHHSDSSRVWSSRSVITRVTFPLSTSNGRSIPTEPSVIYKTTPS